MNVKVVASGSRGNAYVLTQDGAASLLLEAGITYKRLQVALAHKVTRLAGCLVGHEHGDHAQSAWRVAQAGVNVYATAPTLEAMRLTGHRAKPLVKLEARRIGAWTVLPFPAVHDAADPVGFVITADDGDSLLYLSDSAYCAYRFEGLTIVMCEANYSSDLLRENVASGRLEHFVAQRIRSNHMSLERCIELLQANDLSRVRAIHLLHLSSGNSSGVEFKAAVARATGIPTYVAAERTTA